MIYSHLFSCSKVPNKNHSYTNNSFSQQEKPCFSCIPGTFLLKNVHPHSSDNQMKFNAASLIYKFTVKFTRLSKKALPGKEQ